MTTYIHRETAQILAFPFQPRLKLGNGMTSPAGIYEMAPSVVDSNCWYHEEALHAPMPKPDRPKPC